MIFFTHNDNINIKKLVNVIAGPDGILKKYDKYIPDTPEIIPIVIANLYWVSNFLKNILEVIIGVIIKVKVNIIPTSDDIKAIKIDIKI